MSSKAAAKPVRFSEWTQERVPLVIGTNAGCEPVAFQNWRRFKEAFVPELIHRAVRETTKALGRPVQTCLDPCAGSGTTPLACQFLGVEPIAIEVNPFLADLIEAKLTVVDPALVARRLSEVLSASENVNPREFYASAPKTFVAPGIDGRYLFNRDVAKRLASLVVAIDDVRERPVRRLLKVLLAGPALEVCNATVSGKGRRYRRNWEERRVTPRDLDAAFSHSVERALFDIARYARRPTLSYQLIRGDAREKITKVGDIDLAVFSPPYPNSFDYTDVYNIELWGLGYLQSAADNAILRRSTIRSHVQLKQNYEHSAPPIAIARAISKLRGCEVLWNRNIPDMIGAYFADLQNLLADIHERLPKKGRVYLVVGDSRYAGVGVPVAKGLSQLAPALGYRIVSVEPFRSMRASPQQGGQAELSETLLVLAAR